MTSVLQADFARDLAPYHRAVGELLRLCRSVPGGVDRLRAWQAEHRHDLVEAVELIADGGVVVEVRPSAAMLALLADLRGDRKAVA